MQYYNVITNPIWRAAANMKIVMSACLSEKWSDYHEIWYTELHSDCDKYGLTKKIQDGGRTPYCKTSFWPQLDSGLSVFASFCVKMQNLTVITVDCENCQKLEIQDGGQPLPWWSFYRHISVKCHQILMKFDKLKQIKTITKNHASNIKTFKFQMVDRNHIVKRCCLP